MNRKTKQRENKTDDYLEKKKQTNKQKQVGL